MIQISVFDMLKVGIGPSSSHTMGPWKAALQFLDKLLEFDVINSVGNITINLYGSLALTGKGHGTDIALVLALNGYDPESIPLEEVKLVYEKVKKEKTLMLKGKYPLPFDIEINIVFNRRKKLDFHSNGMTIQAFNTEGKEILNKTYFSVGGGFVVEENEKTEFNKIVLPFPIETAKDLQYHCASQGENIAWIVRQNEKAWSTEADMEQNLLKIWDVMLHSMYRGCYTEGVLPGGLNVTRRAAGLHCKLMQNNIEFSSVNEWLSHLKEISVDFEKTLKFISCFAMAVNEENANFGRVVTAPTNGAAGVIPAVLMYYICFARKKEIKDKDIIDFLSVASEIGSIFKKRATISAAMGGCQAEIGVSSAMAAAALTSALGGSVEQSLMASEIAMEHHLGLTCDPINGLVQIPCIERNSMGAIKAITASQIALESNPNFAKVSLDMVINTMWETAKDMSSKYKETSLGGLAVNVSVAITEC